MDGAYAVYRMEGNRFLRDCLAIVSRATPEEIEADGLQSNCILGIIKSKQDLTSVRIPSDLNELDIFDPGSRILLRVGSECLLGMFGDGHCNCESERTVAIREIESVGQGLYLHLPQDGQGQGLFYKAQELQLQVSGYDPTGERVGPLSLDQAYHYLLGADAQLDRRQYSCLRRLFNDLGLNRYEYELLTESPSKMATLQEDLGVEIVACHGLKSLVTADNAGEYLAKLYKDYTLADSELDGIYDVVFRAPELPPRLLELLNQIRHDLSDGKEFQANRALLTKIANIPEARGLKFESADLDLLKDATSYEEFQVELEVTENDVRTLLDTSVLAGLDSLRYEENHFFDLTYLRDVPSRYMKVRYAYRVRDRVHPV